MRRSAVYSDNLYCLACSVRVLALTGSMVLLLATGSALAQETGAVEAYDGPPIYLPLNETPPDPVEVASEMTKFKYPDSEVLRFEREITKFSDDSFHSNGPHREYYTSGQVYAEGAYEKGKATGPWTFYHSNGQKAKEMTYANGQPNGVVKLYNDEGKLRAEREYKQGKRVGKWTNFDVENGEPLEEMTYEEGLASGTWKVWYKNRQLRQEQNFTAGKLEGTVRVWTADGAPRTEANFKEGKAEGETKIWSPDGKVIQKIFKDGQLVSQSEIDG